MWLTDSEQRQLLDDEPGPITGRVRREVAVALRQYRERQEQLRRQAEELKRQVSEHGQKIADHDGKFVELGKSLSTAFGNLAAFGKKVRPGN